MATILDSEDIERSLRRIAHEIIERNRGAEDVMLLGIPTRGVTLAHRLQKALAEVGADVLYSGRTIRSALEALSDIGRPRTVQLAVLIDRGHREVPIRADYVGKNVPTARSERVWVGLSEIDGTDSVRIEDVTSKGATA